MPSPILNLDEVRLRGLDASEGPSPGAPAGYDMRWGDIATRIGARKLGYNLTVVAPGKRNCPFHNHRGIEEMFLILEGHGELRYGEARHPLRPGDVIACPPGDANTAHQIINTGKTELRYLAVSTMDPVDICEYPDSGKFGACARSEDGPPHFRHIGRLDETHDYWEGE
jgi:uncharacterized cupin superfamily protein